MEMHQCDRGILRSSLHSRYIGENFYQWYVAAWDVRQKAGTSTVGMVPWQFFLSLQHWDQRRVFRPKREVPRDDTAWRGDERSNSEGNRNLLANHAYAVLWIMLITIQLQRSCRMNAVIFASAKGKSEDLRSENLRALFRRDVVVASEIFVRCLLLLTQIRPNVERVHFNLTRDFLSWFWKTMCLRSTPALQCGLVNGNLQNKCACQRRSCTGHGIISYQLTGNEKCFDNAVVLTKSCAVTMAQMSTSRSACKMSAV